MDSKPDLRQIFEIVYLMLDLQPICGEYGLRKMTLTSWWNVYCGSACSLSVPKIG